MASPAELIGLKARLPFGSASDSGLVLEGEEEDLQRPMGPQGRVKSCDHGHGDQERFAPVRRVGRR